MFVRQTAFVAVLTFAAPAAALAHPGRVAHVHPHEAPLLVGLALLAAIVVIRALTRRSA